jgi:hypothetical protein
MAAFDFSTHAVAIQLLGAAGSLMYVIAPQFPRTRQSALSMMLGDLLVAAHYLLLGSSVGAAILALASLRGLASAFLPRDQMTPLILASVVAIWTVTLVYGAPVDMLGAFAMTTTAVALYLRDRPTAFRLTFLSSQIPYAAYAAALGSIPVTIEGLANTVSTIIALWRYGDARHWIRGLRARIAHWFPGDRERGRP